MTAALALRDRNAAALLMAHGHSRGEIARELGLSESTVARLKNDPDFQAQVAKFAESTSNSLRPLLETMSTTVIKGVEVGIKTLIDLCDAEDNDGNPLYSVRKDAAAELVAKGLQFLQPHITPAAAGAGNVPPQTSITFNVNTETGKVAVGEPPVDGSVAE